MDSAQKFVLSRVQGAPVSDEEIIKDLRRVATIAGTTKVTQGIYAKYGLYDRRNISRRFRTWNNALLTAGLVVSNEVNLPDEILFANILALWQHYGRQPRRAELSQIPSTVSPGPYNRRFKSWIRALEAFVEYAGSSDVNEQPQNARVAVTSRTGRDPSLRLRFHVLQRDNFRCRACGASPATQIGVELQIDHIRSWNDGGETALENLQTLCSKCNLGKGVISLVAACNTT